MLAELKDGKAAALTEILSLKNKPHREMNE